MLMLHHRSHRTTGLTVAGHLLGILDALTFPGALRQTADGPGASAVSPQAGWTLRLLSDLLDSGAPLITDWHSPGVAVRRPFQRPGDLLAALEARRREVLPQAARSCARLRRPWG
jgi:hypothetical protein